jgi:hypothetical protein
VGGDLRKKGTCLREILITSPGTVVTMPKEKQYVFMLLSGNINYIG